MLPTLFIGDVRDRTFCDAAERLSQQGAKTAGDIPAAIVLIDSGFVPALIVVTQSRSSSIAERQIEVLRRAAPLARIAVLLGSWSEGEMRTGKPLPGVRRMYWHQWRWLLRDFDNASALGGHELWTLPDTATDEERLLAWETAERGRRQASDRATVAIVANHRQTAASLADICDAQGWTGQWVARGEPLPRDANVLLFDAAHNTAAERQQLSSLLQSSGYAVPALVLAGFPREEDVRQWLSAGAKVVVSKPFLARSLANTVRQMLRDAGTVSPSSLVRQT